MEAYEQFAHDYLLVVENDYAGWSQHENWTQLVDFNVYKLADLLQEEYEIFVEEFLQTLDKTGDDYRVNIMREMLLGYGVKPFEVIAERIIATTKGE